MNDPKVFYNKEDLWEMPRQAEKPMEPYYLIMKLPEEKKEEYVLLMPYTPAKRDNLAAWFAARCDEPNYGKLIVFTFPGTGSYSGRGRWMRESIRIHTSPSNSPSGASEALR